ncbi:MAG: PVC-type heme-binding CxxCH protein, partial [Leadbetterella sp.]
VFVFTDENNDDVADKKEVLFTGIKGLQHDHAVHAFVFGPDGKYYFNYGNAGEGLLSKEGNSFKDVEGNIIDGSGKPYREGMVFRCNPDGSDLEILGWNFRNNYELAVDSYGRMWQSDNDDDGNKGTRINYVMDYGNYGYKDEMTGASWYTRRTNKEAEKPLQHWHLNDPGVVPNLVQTYAGSPTGILVYEGDLLPEKYHNQIIHCDAGPNVVRMYPSQKEGAGFRAQSVNILDGSGRDKWFRPSDVTVAPDGSIFVADWYDPGVGGHAMGDLTKGRIYRIAPKKSKYSVPSFDLESAEGAARALKNPNLAVRYLAYTTLQKFGKNSEESLLSLWKSDNPRLRARALSLLIKVEPTKYIQESIVDADEDIRVAGIRLARELKIEILPILSQLVSDKSPQVRREIALALRNVNSPEIWTALALQYKGQDRWYLEALGIAAEGKWDSYMKRYLGQIGDTWSTNDAAKDIVWRSRATDNVYNLAKLIKQSSGTERLRYFRAMDFQKSPDKTKALFEIIGDSPDTLTGYLILNHSDPAVVKTLPNGEMLLNKVIGSIQNPDNYFDLIAKYDLKNQKKKLLNWVVSNPENSLGTEAAQVLIKNNGLAPFKELVEGTNKETAKKAIRVFGKVDEDDVNTYLVSIINNKSKGLELRTEATQAMRGWKGEELLWKLVKDRKLPDDMVKTAKPILLKTWHGDIRAEALQFFGENTDNKVNIESLMKKTGVIGKGKVVFNTYCQTCHLVNAQGVDFGPSLSEIGSKLSKQGLYESIVYPSKGISFGYENYSIKLKNGVEQQGILASKTENDVSLKQMGGGILSIKRSEIKSIDQLAESPMPAYSLKDQELVDLVEYLGSLKKK